MARRGAGAGVAGVVALREQGRRGQAAAGGPRPQPFPASLPLSSPPVPHLEKGIIVSEFVLQQKPDTLSPPQTGEAVGGAWQLRRAAWALGVPASV